MADEKFQITIKEGSANWNDTLAQLRVAPWKKRPILH